MILKRGRVSSGGGGGAGESFPPNRRGRISSGGGGGGGGRGKLPPKQVQIKHLRATRWPLKISNVSP